MTQQQIEAVRADLKLCADNYGPLDLTARALATITALQARVDEAERGIEALNLALTHAEAEEARFRASAVRHKERAEKAEQQLATLRAEVARLNRIEGTVGTLLDANATLRAAIAEAVRRSEALTQRSILFAVAVAIETITEPLRNLDQPVDDRALTSSPVDDSETAETVIKPEGEGKAADPDEGLPTAADVRGIAEAVAEHCKLHGFRELKLTLTDDGGWVCYRNVNPEGAAQPEGEDALVGLIADIIKANVSGPAGMDEELRKAHRADQMNAARIIARLALASRGLTVAKAEPEDALVEALRNASGFLDTPIMRRKLGDDWLYKPVVESIRKALASRGLVRGEGV